jgi:DNA-binding NtrC family response regulator
MEKRVLLVDDDPRFIALLRDTLGTTVNLQVVSIADDVIAICTVWRPHLILLDVLIAPGDSFTILDQITQNRDGIPASVLCLSRGIGSTTRLQQCGDAVFGILERDIGGAALLSIVHRALNSPCAAAA